MRGMTTNELSIVLSFIQEHHSFALWKDEESVAETKKQYPNMDDGMAEHGMCIKYVDMCYDSRDASVWNIKFRGIGNDFLFSVNHFSMLNEKPEHFKFDSLFDWVMAYLRCEWHNNNILKDCQIKPQKI